MSDAREATEKEKQIINRLALKAYETRQSQRLIREFSRIDLHHRTNQVFYEFRFPYPEVAIDEILLEGERKSDHALLIETLGGVCRICGSTKELEKHHIIPLEKNGPDSPGNLVVLCRECHVKTF